MGLNDDLSIISANAAKIHDFVNAAPGTIVTDGGKIINLAMAAQLADEKVDQLSIFNPRGMWATATAYVFRDLVEYDSDIYMVLSDHTSGVFADDLAADKLAIYQDTIATSALITSLANALEGEGVDLVARAKKYVSDVDDLNTTSPGTHTIVYARCFATIGDGGYGDFEWDAVSTATPIRGMIHQVTGNPTGRWIRQLNGFVTPKMVGAVGNGIVNDTAAMQAIRDYAASGFTDHIVFTSGTYLYTTSPNWAIHNLKIEACGQVILRYTGTGNAVTLDAGVAPTTIYGVRFIGDFIVRGGADSVYGYYVRSVHHSVVEGRVESAGVAGLRVEFSVSTDFKVKTSVNSYGTWFGGVQPVTGMSITRRDPGELTTACVFHHPIFEGVSGDGIVLDYASQNTFIGGTSEANARGIVLTANSTGNNFICIDLEMNPGNDIEDAGTGNVFSGVNSTNSVLLTGNRALFTGGSHNTITDNGAHNSFMNLTYGVFGGSLTGADVSMVRFAVLNAAGYFLPDKTYASYDATVSVPSGVATTVLDLTGSGVSGNRTYDISIFSPGLGPTYATTAVVYRDGATVYVINKTEGANCVLSVTGNLLKISHVAGMPLQYTAKASSR